ncbi:MAG TPA: FAD-binding oxidoreductase [Candidatus Omnitrophota bacterium]|nr:FAD-binding oxidoreductase [Candidatus Omnitrophota bacterium]
MLKKTDQSAILSYLEDSSNLKGGHADGLLLPVNEAEIKDAIKECSAKGIRLTVSGGTTGTTGGCIPFGGWLLGMEKLERIIDIDPAKRSATVQPAVTLEKLDAELKKAGLLYPPDPTEATAFIGGTVATNASGSRSLKFGATRDWVRRLKIVLSTGEVLNINRSPKFRVKDSQFNNTHYGLRITDYAMPQVKNEAGYYSQPDMDLLDLFIGSEGTLGVVTEIEVGLIPRFRDTFDIIAFFPDEKEAFDFVIEARKRDALTLEYFDRNSLELLRLDHPLLPNGSGAAVYLETEITEENGSSYLDQWAAALEKHKVKIDDAWLGMNEKQKEDLRKFRHAMPEHINDEFKKHNTVKFASDIAVPDDKFREMFDYYNSELVPVSDRIFWVKFGHIGQNHLHVNLVPRTQTDVPLAKEIIMRFVKKAVSLGGTCSAEHGIGKIKHDYLKEMYGEKGIAEMVRVKKYFDPACVLNRGNIFPEELL